MHVVLDVLRLRLAGLVTMEAIFLIRRVAVFFRIVVVDVVAVQAGHFLIAVDDHVANVVQHVPIAWVDFVVVGNRKIELEVLKQVVARYKVIRVRQPAGFLLTEAHVARRADRRHHGGGIFALFG